MPLWCIQWVYKCPVASFHMRLWALLSVNTSTWPRSLAISGEKNQVSVQCPFHRAETEPQVTSLLGPLHYVQAKQSFNGLKWGRWATLRVSASECQVVKVCHWLFTVIILLHCSHRFHFLTVTGLSPMPLPMHWPTCWPMPLFSFNQILFSL